MKQCLYASRARCEFTAADLDRLLALSRARNEVEGLTGLLVYAGGGFVQVFEGPGHVVEAAFDRIARDPRHEVILHTTRPIEHRHFPTWQMGFVRIPDAQLASPEGYAAVFDEAFDVSAVPGLDALARDLIESLRKLAHPATTAA